MKFTIEIVRCGDIGAPRLLHRAPSHSLGPKWAKAKAERLLEAYRAHGANGARITNRRGEELYNWRKN